jgi:hypothetical protein
LARFARRPQEAAKPLVALKILWVGKRRPGVRLTGVASRSDAAFA